MAHLPSYKHFRWIAFLGAVLLLTGCKSCGSSTSSGYASPTPSPRALFLAR